MCLLGETPTSASLQGVALNKNVPGIDCVPGGLGWLAGAVGGTGQEIPRFYGESQAALYLGHLGETAGTVVNAGQGIQDALHQSHASRMAGAEAGMGQVLCTGDTLEE